MDTEAQHTERDRSSETEERSRSARISGPDGQDAGPGGRPDSRPDGLLDSSARVGPDSGLDRPDSGPHSQDSGPDGSDSAADGSDSAPGGTDSGPHGPDSAAAEGDGRYSGWSWRRTSTIGALCVVFLLLLSHFVLQPFLIPSRSMEPTLQVGDRILVNKLAYRFGDQPRRGDVVVFDGTGSFLQEAPEQNPVTGLLHGAAAALGLAEPAETDFVKRVVGVGGDRVVCCDADGRLTVNGVPVQEWYLTLGDSPSKVPFDIVVPQGTLWVMGDHRSQSSDSRDHLGQPGGGMVPVDRVIGRADWIGWPFGRWSEVEETGAFDAVPTPVAGGHG